MNQRLKLGVLISGRGSNLQALIAACAAPDFPAEIALVVSNRPGAGGLDHARAAGIATCVIDHKGFADREGFDRQVDAALRAAGVELVCLAGFMRLVSPWFVTAWPDRMINIHPALLPAFQGLHTHERALETGCRIHGCTVHFVRAEMDAGPIIMQAAVPVLPGDTPDSLGARVLAAEHRIYPAAVRLIAEHRIQIDGNQVHVAGETPDGAALFSPNV